MWKKALLLVALTLAGLVYLIQGHHTRPQSPDLSASASDPAPNPSHLSTAGSNGTPKEPRAPNPISHVASADAASAPSSVGTPPNNGKVSESALKQILALEEEKAGRSAMQKKIDSQLLFAAKMARNEPIAKGVQTLQVELDRDELGRILVDIKATVSTNLLDEVKNRGGHIVNSYAAYQAIRAALPLNEIETLAARSDVLFVAPAARAERHAGSVTSEGDIAQGAAVARTQFQVTGAGVKVGVMSDSDDYREQSQDSGDLGAVTVLEGQSGRPGSGEGTAMLEIVHDIAPGAELYYATAFNGVASFADNVRRLRAAGCNIIVDDVGYFNESPFQDGPIGQAVDEVTADGALYFSSAGNAGNKNDAQSGVWEGDFADGGQLTAPVTGDGRVHSFGAANFNSVGQGGSSRRVDLFWADPLGRAENDYDVYILDSNGANVVGASSNTQSGTQDPYESVNKLEIAQQLVVVRYSGAPRYIRLSTGRGRLGYSTGGQTKGHNSAVNAFCVAAVSAANARAAFTTGAKVETFSSDGLRRIFFTADGTAITPGNFTSTGGVVRQKPDIAAADGVVTTLPADSGLNPFYGTSAAAPHAGAIAALLMSFRPGLTAAEYRSALTKGTLDIESAGTDRDAGYGLVMADLVLEAVGAGTAPTITGFSPNNGPAGTTVTISGSKFNQASSVRFNGVEATFTVVSSSQITAVVPTGASTGPVSVVTPGGEATSTSSFTVTAAPVVTGFTPTGGNVGTIVIVSGVNLTGATAVSFNSTPATFTVDSSTQITATVPAGATTGRIVITTPAGTAQSAGVFTVTTAPVITGFDPAAGPVGSTVTISGANFVNVTAVKFNGVSASSPTILSSSQIRAVVPTGATTGPITVTTAAGTAQTTESFTLSVPPVITALTPSTGVAGTVVTLTGTGFSGATGVTFNGVTAAAFAVLGDTKITAAAPTAVTTGPVRVTTPRGTGASAIPFTVADAPGNDDFAAAQVLPSNSGSVSGNSQTATKQPGEPNHAGNAGGKSVWYRWTAPTAGTWTFDTVSSDFDTLLAVYQGGALADLQVIAWDDDIVDGSVTNSRVAFVAAAGATYFIAVDGYWGGAQNAAAAASGQIKLNWQVSAAIPAITGFSPASGPAGTMVTIDGANFAGATTVSFNGAAATFTVNSATQITASVPALATTGPVTVSSSGGTATSAGIFTVSTSAGNDQFKDAFSIAGTAGSTNCQNLAATKETGEPAHAGNVGGKSVWFVWTAPENGLWTIDTFGSSFDTVLAVYTGTSVTTLTTIGSNDDWNGTSISYVPLNATAGTTYRIAVDGYSGASGTVVLNWSRTEKVPVVTTFSPPQGGAGTPVVLTGANLGGAVGVKFNGVGSSIFSVNSDAQVTAVVPAGASTGPITVTCTNGVAQSAAPFIIAGAAPLNDSFAQRIALTGAPQTVTGLTVQATKEPGEPNHAGNSGGASVWWTWTAPVTGTFSVSTRNSDFDTTLAVYTGNTLTGLSVLASSDDGRNMGRASLVTFAATAGTAYQIAVDGYDGEQGKVVLTIYPSIASELIYYTGFDQEEGYSTLSTLAGQAGWKVQGEGQNGVVFDFFGDGSQQAYIGVSAPLSSQSQFLWQDLAFTPNTNRLPVVTFSTYMEIADSTDFEYDDFGWDVYNQQGQRLFFLDFDNSDLHIYYRLNDSTGFHDTGIEFDNGELYFLEISMDFAANVWNAFLDGDAIVTGQPISATNTVALSLGDIDAAWLRGTDGPGDNAMLFDDYQVTAGPNQAPRIITPPQSQSVTVNGSVELMVVADSRLEVTYQWQLDGKNIPGANGPSLLLNNVSFSQAGKYTVIVSNVVSIVTSAPATISIDQLPNLAPYKPAGWSDAIVIANSPATNNATAVSDSDDLYVTWAVLNRADGGNTTNRFYTQLFLDGTLKHTWYSDGLAHGSYTFAIGYNLGKLAAGTHALRVDTDTTGVVPETDEGDNTFTRAFVVAAGTNAAPRIGTFSRLADGTFNLNISGIPSRTYEIQGSSDLVNWSTLATLKHPDTGLLQYSDPAATQLNHRFYRCRLLP